MKRLIAMFWGLVFASFLQAADITQITSAMKSGKASELVNVWDEQVDVAIDGASQVCDAKGAGTLMDAFFHSNPPSSFVLLHHAEKPTSGFVVAKLIAGEKTYRVNISYEVKDNKAIIQSIRIE